MKNTFALQDWKYVKEVFVSPTSGAYIFIGSVASWSWEAGNEGKVAKAILDDIIVNMNMNVSKGDTHEFHKHELGCLSFAFDEAMEKAVSMLFNFKFGQR